MRLSTLADAVADAFVFVAVLFITTVGSCEKKVQCGPEARDAKTHVAGPR